MQTYSTSQVLNNRYRIVRLLGQGGFGAVYRAWDLNLGQACVLKENHVAGADAQQQFYREAQILAKVSHSSLPKVFDHFISPSGGQCLVMSFIDGQDLEDIIKSRRQIAETDIVKWGAQICDALQYLHTLTPPIFHRDIKPANIRITPEGNAMLVDFGIAKAQPVGDKTVRGALAGTPHFAPPEQYMAQGLSGPYTDIYSLGATLYVAATGAMVEDSIARLEGEQQNKPVRLPAPKQLNSAISLHISEAITKAINLAPKARHASAEQFKAALLGTAPVVIQKKTMSSGNKINVWAVLSVLATVASFFVTYYVPVVANLIGVIFGHIALRQQKQSPQDFRLKWLATLGLLMGYSYGAYVIYLILTLFVL